MDEFDPVAFFARNWPQRPDGHDHAIRALAAEVERRTLARICRGSVFRNGSHAAEAIEAASK